MWQDLAAFVIVAAAAVYLVWKLGWASRPPGARRRGGPDVPVGKLVRDARKKKRG
jgi:hypothetical protein